MSEKINLLDLISSTTENEEKNEKRLTRNEEIDMETKETELKNFKYIVGARKKYARLVFIFAIIWIFIVLFIVTIEGFNFNFFHLSNIVLATLIGSTTTNILGVFIIVMKYIFYPK